MSDFGDEALSIQERDLADIMAARRVANSAPTPASDICAKCGGTIEPERREVLPKTNVCGDCAAELNRGRR
ncbi:MAG TPA: TraR/DksA C4-type zinc finger protein [Azospirillum sp.]|nr:TraR/DksA C4-type zinc finger protein [Azospirillum sp.]